MKVKELIERLERLDKNLEVFVEEPYDDHDEFPLLEVNKSLRLIAGGSYTTKVILIY